MKNDVSIELKAPYIIFVGGSDDSAYAKTGLGIVHWRPNLVAGQIRVDSSSVNLGVPDLTIAQAVDAGVRSFIIGVASIGGGIPEPWLKVIEEAALAGLDIVSGMHSKLADFPRIATAAEASGARLIDVRFQPSLPIASGAKRSGKRLLMVGTDCGVGKKYSALALDMAMRDAGMNSTFRATGQTGIMIAGSGIPIDAVIADFISGAAEVVSPDNDDDHWDIIEGQGSLFHPGFAGVTLGLLHGSQPDAIVVCHEANRKKLVGWPDYSVPSIADCIELNLLAGRLTNPKIQCVGISVNTSTLPDGERLSYLATLSSETGLPCIDPIGDGCAAIVDEIRARFG